MRSLRWSLDDFQMCVGRALKAFWQMDRNNDGFIDAYELGEGSLELSACLPRD